MRRGLVAAIGLALGAALPACAGLMLGGPSTPGQRLYLSKCTTCHRAYQPAHFSPDHWRGAVAKMERKGRVHLTEDERAAILGYLTGAERARPDAGARPGAR